MSKEKHNGAEVAEVAVEEVAVEAVPIIFAEEVDVRGDVVVSCDVVVNGGAIELASAEAEVLPAEFPLWEFPPVILPTTANARITAELHISVVSGLPAQNTGIGLADTGLAVRNGEGTTIASLLLEQAGHSLTQMRQIVSVFAGISTASTMADTANQAVAARLSAMADKAATRSNREQFLVRQQAECSIKFSAESDGVSLRIEAAVDDSVAESVQQKVITAQALAENVWKFAGLTKALGVELVIVVNVAHTDIAWGLTSPAAASVTDGDVDLLLQDATLAGELVALLAAGPFGYTAASLLIPVADYATAVAVKKIEVGKTATSAVHFYI